MHQQEAPGCFFLTVQETLKKKAIIVVRQKRARFFSLQLITATNEHMTEQVTESNDETDNHRFAHNCGEELSGQETEQQKSTAAAAEPSHAAEQRRRIRQMDKIKGWESQQPLYFLINQACGWMVQMNSNVGARGLLAGDTTTTQQSVLHSTQQEETNWKWDCELP